MRTSERFKVLNARSINKDVLIKEWPEKGFVSMESEFDPEPGIKTKDGKIIELDGKPLEQFDIIDHFIAGHAIDIDLAEKVMAMDSRDIARKVVDINVPREEIVKLTRGMTPAKLVKVLEELNAVEIMMGIQKMRTRRTPANQAHACNIRENPVQMAADAAENSLRGFVEQETTADIVRCAPSNALAILVGSQVGRAGCLTQCSIEEATELSLGMQGLTSYAETVSVYGTERVFVDGDDTPWSKAFLAAAYASRGIKMRYTSGSGSEVLMGYSEGKSMLYLEARCLYITKGSGVQGTQTGSTSCMSIPGSVPNGVRCTQAEYLAAMMLDLEVAGGGNDAPFTFSDIRRAAKLVSLMFPGAEYIVSGFSGVPNRDNAFSGSGWDVEDIEDICVIQRDHKVDAGLIPRTEDEVLAIRYKAARAMQAVYEWLGLPPVSDEEIEAAVNAHSSDDMPERDIHLILDASQEILSRPVTCLDIVKALAHKGFIDIAERLLNLLKLRISGDYLQTAAMVLPDFHVLSAINDPNKYSGPGTGYRISDERWNEIKNVRQEQTKELIAMTSQQGDGIFAAVGVAEQGIDSEEIVIGIGPKFGQSIRATLNGLSHSAIMRELLAGIEEEGLKSRIVRIKHTSDVAFIGKEAAVLSGSGIGIGIQSKGTIIIHQKDLLPLQNLELFPQAPLLGLDSYRVIAKNAAQYAKQINVTPVPTRNDWQCRPKYLAKSAVFHAIESEDVVKSARPVEVKFTG